MYGLLGLFSKNGSVLAVLGPLRNMKKFFFEMFCKAKLPVMLHAAKTKAQFYGKKNY